MRPEYKGTPKFCREPDCVQLVMRAFSHALVIKSVPVHKDSGCQGSGHLCHAQPLPHGFRLTNHSPPPRSLSPPQHLCPSSVQSCMHAHPVKSFLSHFGPDQTCEDSTDSLSVSPAYIRMNEKRLQREKELLENCELDFLAQKTIPPQQCGTKVPGKVTDTPVLGDLGTEGKGCALPFCTAPEQPLWVWEPGVHIPSNRQN